MVAMQITSAVAGLLAIPETIANFTEPAGECHRVGELFEVMDDVKQRLRAASSATASSATGETRASQYIAMEDVTIRTPDNKRALFNGLSFSVKHGESLLISGPSGTTPSFVVVA